MTDNRLGDDARQALRAAARSGLELELNDNDDDDDDDDE